MSVYAHRRGSIFWALTLIAVGGLFLYHNFDPSLHPWQIIAKFWPVLIIFWGLSKLIDYVHAQAHPETVAPPLFSGSEVVLLVLILLLGTLISHVVLHPWREWPNAVGINMDDDFGDLFLNSYPYTSTLSQSVSATPVRLLVVNRRGDVQIESSNQKSIDAVIKETIRAESEDAARKVNEQLKFSMVEEAGHYVFQSNLDSIPPGRAGEGLVVSRSVRLDIVLRVPRGTSTEITAERGDISVDGLEGNQTLSTKHGDVRVAGVEGLVKVHKSQGDTQVRDVKGNVEVNGRGGDVDIGGVSGTVTVSGDFSGAVQFRDIAQSLRFSSSRTDLTTQRLSGRLYMERGSLDARGVDGPFDLSTRQKDINLDGFAHSLKISDANGEIRLRASSPPKQSIDVTSERGGIELALPEGSNFQIQANSSHGEVESDFSGPGLKVVREGDAPSISGIYGKGGPLIRLTTSYGTIRLARQGPLPPATPKAPAPPASPAEKETLYREQPRHAREPLVAHQKPEAARPDSLKLLPILVNSD